MESFKLNSENNNYFAGGVIVIGMGILEIIVMIIVSCIQGSLTIDWIAPLSIVICMGIIEIWLGYKICKDTKNRYAIFQGDVIEVHNYDDVRYYNTSQVVEIKELVVNGGRGYRILYQFKMEDRYVFQVTKDKRLKDKFSHLTIEKKHCLKIEYKYREEE